VGFLWADGTATTFSGESGDTMPLALGLAKKIAMSYGHLVALLQDGSVACFGNNDFGRCDVPSGLGPAIDVAAGATTTTAVTTSGEVVCWGNCPQPGLPSTCVQLDAAIYPIALSTTGVLWSPSGSGGWLPGLSGVVDFEVEEFHGLALLADGSTIGWGDNQYGEASSLPPSGTVRDIATGADHMLVIREPGVVEAIGSNLYGQTAVPDDLPTDIVFAAAGWTHSAVAGPSGLVQWGLHAPLEIPPGRIEYLGAYRFTTVVIVDTDQDGDGVLDVSDNCVEAPNPAQEDCDGDGVGDACVVLDPTADCDANGIPDSCQILEQPSLDSNGDGILDACVPVPCYGDLNGDDIVNGADLAILLAFWGPSGLFPAADIDASGAVDGADLAILLSGWGEC
jgi:hypothetical protein